MKKTFHIQGMHCVSCETLLEKELQNTSGISSCKASHAKKTLKIEGENIPTKKIKQAVKKCGYTIVDAAEKKAQTQKIKMSDIAQIVAIFLGVFFLMWLLFHFEIARFFPDTNKNVGFAVAALLGIVASVSTCLALTGGIVMSFSSEYTVVGASNPHSFFHRALPQIYFHIGRVLGFFLLGGILGMIGSTIAYSISFTGYLSIFVAIIMFYIGLHLLNLVPSITRFGFHLPKKITEKITALQKKEHPLLPATIGVLTFFLPCGFTQSMQLAAVASGSFITGGLLMAFFAVGTIPVLFSVGLGSSYAQKKNFGFFKKIVGVVIVFFALYSFQSGLTLAGSNMSIDFWSSKKTSETVLEKSPLAKQKDGVQVVQMDIDYTFQQNEFRVKKGIPVRWEINPIRVSGCTDEVIIPRLDLSTGKIYSTETKVIEFTPTETGILPFSCWMGMQGGKFIIE